VASDYQRRQLGAAQIQILMDATLPEQEQIRIAGEILDEVRPAIGALESRPSADQAAGESHHE